MFNKMRILHCPTITGGNAQNICKGERILGLKSWSVTFQQNYLGYPCDEVLWDRDTPLWKQQIRAWKLLFFAFKNFDVIHYNSGTPILPWDIPTSLNGIHPLQKKILIIYTILCKVFEQNLLKKKVIAVTFQGDDARQGDFCIRNFSFSIAHDVSSGYYSEISDERKKNRIKMFDQYADLIYALNPDLLYVLPLRAVFMPYAIDTKSYEHVKKKDISLPLVIHAPSHRGAKGTKYILAAVEQLRAEGVLFDFLLVENLSNSEAIKVYEKSDLVIDQLLAGWYGAFAVESMALGKPVICYLRENDLHLIPTKMRDELPIINANPDSIYAVLRDWLKKWHSNYETKEILGRRFAARWHDPVQIAGKLSEDYRRIALKKACR
jgi:hypothetical protein